MGGGLKVCIEKNSCELRRSSPLHTVMPRKHGHGGIGKFDDINKILQHPHILPLPAYKGGIPWVLSIPSYIQIHSIAS